MSLWLAPVEAHDEDEPEPCPVCGCAGACSYDAEGRPLIHTDTQLPKDSE